MIKFTEDTAEAKKIVVIGIGGTGCSVVEKINTYNLNGIKTFYIDLDTEAVNNSTITDKIFVPNKLAREFNTENISTSANQELAKALKPFIDSLPKAEIVFTVCGLGGIMGTVIAPIVLQMLKEKSFWVWSVNTIPFFFEGKTKILNSLRQLKPIQQYSSAIFAIPHDKVFKMVDKELSMKEAFTPAGSICVDLIIDVYKLTSGNGVNKRINIKFSDIKDKLSNKRSTSFGIGEGVGQDRMITAFGKAINSSLLGREILSSAERVIVNISGSEGLKLDEVNKGMEFLYTQIPKEKNIIFGVTIDNKLQDSVKADIIVIGIDTGSADNWGLSLSNDTNIKESAIPQGAELAGRFSKLGRQSQPQTTQKHKQTMIDFKKMAKGCFEKSEATLFGGEDLDVPTFLRRKK